jgi:hypothetical protein
VRAALLALALCAGCSSEAERRLLIIQQAKIVLKHSTTEHAWLERRAKLEANIEGELANDE